MTYDEKSTSSKLASTSGNSKTSISQRQRKRRFRLRQKGYGGQASARTPGRWRDSVAGRWRKRVGFTKRDVHFAHRGPGTPARVGREKRWFSLEVAKQIPRNSA